MSPDPADRVEVAKPVIEPGDVSVTIPSLESFTARFTEKLDEKIESFEAIQTKHEPNCGNAVRNL